MAFGKLIFRDAIVNWNSNGTSKGEEVHRRSVLPAPHKSFSIRTHRLTVNYIFQESSMVMKKRVGLAAFVIATARKYVSTPYSLWASAINLGHDDLGFIGLGFLARSRKIKASASAA